MRGLPFIAYIIVGRAYSESSDRFQSIREKNFKIPMDKSEFLQKVKEFLGHVVTREGIKLNSRKIEAIQKFQIPKTGEEIKSFLGLLNKSGKVY